MIVFRISISLRMFRYQHIRTISISFFDKTVWSGNSVYAVVVLCWKALKAYQGHDPNILVTQIWERDTLTLTLVVDKRMLVYFASIPALTKTEDNIPLRNGADADDREVHVSNGNVVDTIPDVKQPKQKPYTILHLFKSKRLLITSLIMWFAW